MRAEQIQQWLLQNSTGTADDASRCVVTGPFASRDNSRLFIAKCADFPSTAVVKLCLRPRTCRADPEAAQRQYDALVRTSQAMNVDSDFSVPQPYLLDAARGLLAVQWIAGKSMTDIVFSWRCNAARAQDLMARAGHWLKIFHTAHVLPDGQLDIDEKLASANRMERDRAVPDSVFFRAVSLLREAAGAAAAAPLARSWLHGDFKSDNLMISGLRTVGIDIHLRHENVVIYDLAPFLNYIDLRLCHPSGWRLRHSRELLHVRFLTSYFSATWKQMALPLAWVRLYLLLGEWHTAHANARSHVRTRMIDLCYRSVALRICRTIAES